MSVCYPGEGQDILFFSLLSPASYGLLFPGLGTQASGLEFQVMGSIGFGNPGRHLPESVRYFCGSTLFIGMYFQNRLACTRRMPIN